MGEEAFRGVAICCFGCPVVETVGSYSQPLPLNLNRAMSVSVYETETLREKKRRTTLQI